MSIGFTEQARLHQVILTVLALGLGGCDTGMDAAARAEHHLVAGVEALEAGEFDRAWPLCDAAWRLQPEASGALRCAALAAVGWGRWDLAVQALDAMLEQSPSQEEDSWIWITLWLARVRSGDRAGAARAVEDLGDGSAAAEIRRGILALALDEGVDAPEWGFPRTEVETWGGVLPLIWAQRNLPADASPAVLLSGDVEVADYLALRAALEGRNPEGGAGSSPSLDVSEFCEGTREAPGNQAIGICLDAICLERRGEPEAALALYDEAVGLAPWHRTGRLNRALLLARMGRLSAARVELKHLSMEVPGHPILLVLEGLLAGADGDMEYSAVMRSEVEDLAPAYAIWMDEVLAE